MNAKGGRHAASRKTYLVNDPDRSAPSGRPPAELEIRWSVEHGPIVRIDAVDEREEIALREALEERDVGFAVALAVWRFCAALGSLEPLQDFPTPDELLRGAVA